MRRGSIARAAVRRIPVTLAIALAFVGGIAVGRAASGPEPERVPEWSVVAELSQPRAYGRAVALATGEVLVFGGLDPGDPQVTLGTTELFDPASGRVSVLPQRLLGRLNQAVSVGWGDRVVVTGGTQWLGMDWGAVSDVDVYLPWSRTWLRAAPMRQARSDHAATALLDGRILVTGGHYDLRLLRSTEIYDPSTDSWAAAAPLPRGRAMLSAATLPDGRVLVAGGFDGTFTRATFIYDPRIDRWSEGPLTIAERLNHVMAALPNGDVLLFGGEQSGAGIAERYDWRARQFVHAGTLAVPRLVAQGAALPDGRVLAVGGLPEDPLRTRFAPTTGVELWDPLTASWAGFTPAPTGRAFGVLVVTERGVFRVSGSGPDELAFSTIEALVWK